MTPSVATRVAKLERAARPCRRDQECRACAHLASGFGPLPPCILLSDWEGDDRDIVVCKVCASAWAGTVTTAPDCGTVLTGAVPAESPV